MKRWWSKQATKGAGSPQASWRLFAALVLGLVLLVAVNALANRQFGQVRLDLTEQKLYTLSAGSRALLAAIDEPVTLRFFLSRELATRLPGIASYARRVEELLEEFDRLGGDAVRLERIDPEPFSEQEDRAVAAGLQGVPVGGNDTLFYFGLVASGATDAEEVIPFFPVARENLLEYDLARVVHQVSETAAGVVGVLSGLPLSGAPGGAMMGMPGTPLVMLEQVAQFFDLRQLPVDTRAIPSEVDVLMLVAPGRLPPAALYAVDQYVLAGGHALVFVDPHAESDPASSVAAVDGAGRDALLRSWGLALRTDAVAADLNLAERVRTASGNRNVVIDYPVWLGLVPSLYDGNDVVTAHLGDVLLASAGVLDALPTENVVTTALIRTTEAATTVPPSALLPGTDPAALVRDYQGGGEPLTLAMRVRGEFASAWPDGPPPGDGDDGAAGQGDDDAVHLAASTAPAELVVVADTDLLQDRFWVSTQNLLGSSLAIPTAANNSLVINALENLSGDENLVSIRGRGGSSRPFTLLEAVRRDAEQRYLQKERELLDALDATEQRLRELAGQAGDDGLVLGADTEAELDRFRERKVAIRKDLRDVQHNLRQDIESIRGWIRFANIGLVPLLVGIGGIAYAGFRRRPRRPRRSLREDDHG